MFRSSKSCTSLLVKASSSSSSSTRSVGVGALVARHSALKNRSLTTRASLRTTATATANPLLNTRSCIATRRFASPRVDRRSYALAAPHGGKLLDLVASGAELDAVGLSNAVIPLAN
jgi:hypothetical protein